MVAAVMEVMLVAMQLYAEDTGDRSVWSFLPVESWQTLHSHHIKAHIWVNHSLNSYGTADALVHFGMGETVPFEQLPEIFQGYIDGAVKGRTVIDMGE